MASEPMTFEHGLSLELARLDGALAKLRAMAADPDHLNIDSGDLKSARADVQYTLETIHRLKLAWETAKRRQREAQERPQQ